MVLDWHQALSFLIKNKKQYKVAQELFIRPETLNRIYKKHNIPHKSTQKQIIRLYQQEVNNG